MAKIGKIWGMWKWLGKYFLQIPHYRPNQRRIQNFKSETLFAQIFE